MASRHVLMLREQILACLRLLRAVHCTCILIVAHLSLNAAMSYVIQASMLPVLVLSMHDLKLCPAYAAVRTLLLCFQVLILAFMLYMMYYQDLVLPALWSRLSGVWYGVQAVDHVCLLNKVHGLLQLIDGRACLVRTQHYVMSPPIEGCGGRFVATLVSFCPALSCITTSLCSF